MTTTDRSSNAADIAVYWRSRDAISRCCIARFSYERVGDQNTASEQLTVALIGQGTFCSDQMTLEEINFRSATV